MDAVSLPVLACAGCGTAAGPDDPFPFSCRRARSGDDVDHVLTLAPWPADAGLVTEAAENPFVRYRHRLYSWRRARSGGLTDAAFVARVEALDRAVRSVDGRGFRVTPFARQGLLGQSLGFSRSGGVWVKDETDNVAGSHKARHLFGVALHLDVSERLGAAGSMHTPAPPPQRLAIASCGNAALAAAVVARAMNRSLDVYVPPDAEPPVLRQLGDLGAALHTCPRTPGAWGDPCYLAFRNALLQGALPFCCQGPENGLTIEGGQTLTHEVIQSLRAQDLEADRFFVQVGGGALGSACAQALRQARDCGLISRLPRLHTVQTRGAFPLRRAWERMVVRLAGAEAVSAFPTGTAEDDARAAEVAREAVRAGRLDAVVRYAATHRSEFMRPWDSVPRSIARGILDDETYDWLALCRAMLESGGWPVVVDEDSLKDAHARAHATTSSRVSPTGTAGLAGLADLRRAGVVDPGERAVVLFTGVTR